jgi:hypothetical protein
MTQIPRRSGVTPRTFHSSKIQTCCIPTRKTEEGISKTVASLDLMLNYHVRGVLHIIFVIPMTINDVNLSLGLQRGQWPEFLKKEGRRTFPEKRSCILLCKNPIKEDVRTLLYRKGAKMPSFCKMHHS